MSSPRCIVCDNVSEVSNNDGLFCGDWCKHLHYQEQDAQDGMQAYQDLLEVNDRLCLENDELHSYIANIAALIHYQAPLDEQDKWLANMIECGFFIVEDDDE